MMMEREKILSDDLNYYISAPIRRQLLKAKKDVTKKNQDRVYVFDGREGVGKSTVTLQIANFLDPNFGLDNVVFNADDFEKKLRELPKYSALVFDEAFNGLSSKGALSKQNKKLIRLLMECRQRNLFIFIVLPTLFLLERYAAIFRSQSLFHCYQIDGRRYYKVYNYTNKKILYIKGKNIMSYNYPFIRKSHRFYGKFPDSINVDKYIKKKLEAFRDEEKKEPEESKIMKHRTGLSIILKDMGVSFVKQSEKLVELGVDAPHHSVLAKYAAKTR